MIYKNTDTPCIGICSTVYGDNVCRGCKRFAAEIIEWNTYSPTQKSDILARLERLTTEVVTHYLIVNDAKILEQKCRQLNVRYRQEFDPLSWAYMLLKMRNDKINCLEECGIQILPDYNECTLSQLLEKMDADIFAASEKSLQTLAPSLD